MENKKSALKAIRKGDEVVVISGSRKEKNGKPALRSCSRIENGILELQSGKPGKQKLCVKRGEAPVRGVVIGLQRSL